VKVDGTGMDAINPVELVWIPPYVVPVNGTGVDAIDPVDWYGTTGR
jgi:hypothetical protein